MIQDDSRGIICLYISDPNFSCGRTNRGIPWGPHGPKNSLFMFNHIFIIAFTLGTPKYHSWLPYSPYLYFVFLHFSFVVFVVFHGKAKKSQQVYLLRISIAEKIQKNALWVGSIGTKMSVGERRATEWTSTEGKLSTLFRFKMIERCHVWPETHSATKSDWKC